MEKSNAGLAGEQHYSVQEVAKLWHVSPHTVRKLFFDHPCVLKIGHGEMRFKRQKWTLRIPESVLRAVHEGSRKADRIAPKPPKKTI